jgi:DNA-binding NtrC family response regulator
MQMRNLIFVDLSNHGVSPPSLEGWLIASATDIHETKMHLKSGKEWLVGAMAIGDFSVSTIQAIEEHLLMDNCMEWIAILPAHCLESMQLCEIITNNFFDYHLQPIDIPRLLTSLGHAYGKARLKHRIKPDNPVIDFYSMIGTSPPMQIFYEKLRRIQHSDAPVLIRGESGTGKELTAQAIHLNSARRNRPFIAVNCGALPATLIQSELFGHEKGAFTGAMQRKIGRFEAASGGTIFLDEIGDLPSELQVNLLRFLQEKTIERVGSTQPIPLDVRIISATHIDLERAVRQQQFRKDLFYRLNVLALNVPPLRERGLDVELLARTFLEKFSKEANVKSKNFSRQALEFMITYRWPGNVRELSNRIQKAVILSENRLIRVSDLGFDENRSPFTIATLDVARKKAELETVKNCLAIYNNNVSRTARHLGISRMTMYRLISKLNL